MSSHSCPFRRAFDAVLPVAVHADPTGPDADIFGEYDFDQAARFMLVRSVLAAGPGAFLTGTSTMADALRKLSEFVAEWSECACHSGLGEQVAAAGGALSVALNETVLAAAAAGASAGFDAIHSDAGPFVAAGPAAAAAGYVGEAAAAFVSGFLAALPSRPVRVDPVSGVLVRG